MLTKPLTHLRPLLRLPSHTHTASGPEHFSANPSIVHHLPQNGSANGLVTSAQGSASTAGGSSGNAGRAGWTGSGPGAGSGGYTGHARAFLSLPQTSLVDSSSLTSSDDTSTERRRRLLLRKRLLDAQGRQTRIVTIADGPGRIVNKQIAAREGSGRVGLVELESGQVLAVEEGKVRGRRSSIAFPTSAAQAVEEAESQWSGEITPMATPPSSRSSTPTRTSLRTRQPLTRSRTSLDLWRVGVPQSSSTIPARALSTRTLAASLPEVDELDRPPAVRIVQDLAGLDLPLSRLGRVRRNSSSATAAVANKSAHEQLQIDEDTSDSRLATEQAAADAVEEEDHETIAANQEFEQSNPMPELDPFERAILDAKSHKDRKRIERLVQYYRTPPESTPEDSELAARFPLHGRRKIRHFNACIDALLSVREPGQTIAPVLDMYNEIIERDVIPNRRTYSLVIAALCNRERDVYAATARDQSQRMWHQWVRDRLGETVSEHFSTLEDEERIIGYLAEKNLASALRLFDAALTGSKNFGKFEGRAAIVMLNQIFATIAASPEPDSTTAMSLFRQIPAEALQNLRPIYRYMFNILGKAGDKDALESLWEQFESTRKAGQGMNKENWKEFELSTGSALSHNTRVSASVVEHHRRTLNAYLDAIVRCGEYDKAISLVELLIDPPADTDSNDLPVPPGVNHPMLGQLIVSLANAGQVEAAMTWWNRTLQLEQRTGSNAYLPIRRDLLVEVSSALLLRGEWRKVYEMNASQFWARPPNSPQPDVAHSQVDPGIGHRLYIAILATACEARADVSKVDEILSLLRPLIQSFEYNPWSEIAIIHFDLLADLNRYSDLLVLAQYWKPRGYREPEAIERLAQRLSQARSFIEQCKFAEQMSILTLFERFRVRNVGEMMVDYYAATRPSVESPAQLGLSAELWGMLYRAFSRLGMSDGDRDEAAISFMADLKQLTEADPQFLRSTGISLLQKLGRGLANRLVERFGRDRAVQMLEPLRGVVPVEMASEVATSASEATTPATDFTIPTTPSDPSAPSSPVAITGPPLHFDGKISSHVDLHTWRAPPITPMQAYDAIQQAIRSTGAAPYPEAIGRLMNNLARSGAEPQVRELYALGQHLVATHDIDTPEQPRKWQVIEDAMLQAMCFLGHLEEAGMHRARIIGACLVPSSDSYATMIACSKDTTDDALVARELYEESQRLGIRPNLYLYNTIISKLSKARKAEVAIDLFKQMKAVGIEPSSVTYGAVINACCRVGDAESAATLFEEMSSMPKFRPRVPPYNTMMQFHLQTAPSRDRILYYYGRLRAHRVPPSGHTYKLLMDAYASLPPMDIRAVEKVFADLCADKKVPVQGNHWGSLISAYGLYGGDVAKALQVFESIPSHPSGVDLSKEPVVWEGILNVLSRRGTLEQLEEMRQRMIASGARSTAYVYNVLISGYARHGQLETARALFASLGDSVTGVAAPNNHPVLLTSSGHVKPATITHTPTDIVYREPSTYEAMIHAELAAGNIPEAEAVLKIMEDRRYPVAVFMRAKAIVDGASASVISQGTPSNEAPAVHLS
ncbi:hypothetical protein BCR39DRAFT_542448 [Naematelia encephala]|uniref:Pentacotripeptide-repeat region of PRORP domain-containing protein n=1 Tax=Naematelia encephala TaxID=71784 RepID=A0A1Y2AUW3_9TREE|nr:hypothetical protein BCR39DRAFT_542448 [Naematelia encephala]